MESHSTVQILGNIVCSRVLPGACFMSGLVISKRTIRGSRACKVRWSVISTEHILGNIACSRVPAMVHVIWTVLI